MRQSGFVAAIVLFLSILLMSGGYIIFRQYPSIGAQGADLLRVIIGDKAVAKLEELLFQADDRIFHLQFALGLARVEAPWQVVVENTETPVWRPSAEDTKQSLLRPISPSVPVITEGEPQNTKKNGTALPDITPATPAPTFAPMPTVWAPASARSSGSIEGEGVWVPYIRDSQDRIVAYRTFLLPDPERPYSVVAVVAFDVDAVRLHFVLGFEEPYNPDAPKRSGKMSEENKIPGKLLAAFNGGFKAQHGGAGAMADGLVVLPPKDGLGTVAVYTDGRIILDEWGGDFVETDDMEAWRQNGPLVVKNGEINPRIYNSDPKDWGYTVDDVSPTLRSGIGISSDGKTLYYLAGPKMTMESLANSMLMSGISNGIQLDINNYWVHFVTYAVDAQELVPEPLLPDLMIENLNRYLFPFGRDYFYITSTQ